MNPERWQRFISEVHWAPGFHIPKVKKLKLPKTCVPILKMNGEVIQDSTQILLWMEENFPENPLLPQDPILKKQVLAWNDDFEKLGWHLRRYVYWQVLPERSIAIELLGNHLEGWEKKTFPLIFPLVRLMIRKALNINQKSGERSLAIVRDYLDKLEHQLETKSPFLVGNQFTFADLSIASLMAPLALPKEHPVYADMRLPEKLENQLQEFSQRPGIHWVKNIYEKYRRSPSSPTQPPQ